MKNLLIIFLILITLLTLAGILNWLGTDFTRITGSGNVITKDIEVSDFNKISLSGMGNLIIQQGDEESLTIEAEDNIIGEIIAEVKDNTLDIRYKRTGLFSWLINPTRDVDFNIKVKDIGGINISGSGTVTADKIKTDSLNITISGSGKVDLGIQAKTLKSNVSGSGSFNLSGQVDSQELSISGSGKYRAKDLKSKKAVIGISGSGKAEINTQALDVTISGSGDVFYLGDPKITQKISGSGKLEQIEGSIDKPDDPQPFQKHIQSGTFFGTLNLIGYLDIRTKVCEPGNMCGQTVEYASLVITESDRDLIYEFIGRNEGNSFIAPNGIGLGCYQKDQNRIYSTNFGDVGQAENIVSGSDLEKLLSSNIDNLVKMQITKPLWTSGSGAPDCYSHFREFEVF